MPRKVHPHITNSLALFLLPRFFFFFFQNDSYSLSGTKVVDSVVAHTEQDRVC